MSDDISSYLDQIRSESDFFKRATLLNFLKTERGVRIKDLSTKLEMKASYICHILRLNKLPDLIRDGYYSSLVSVSHLFIIARLKSHEDMLNVYEEVLSNNLTALQTDELVRKVLYSVTGTGKHVPASELDSLINRLKTIHPDIHVKVTQTRVKGKVAIEIKGGLEHTTPIIQSIIRKLGS